MTKQFLLDGQPVPFEDGQTILEAARIAGHYIPSLCWHKDFAPHGSCKLCIVKAAGRHVSACATPAKEGWEVESNSPEMNGERRGLLRRAALTVDGRGRHRLGEPRGQHRVAADVEALRADLGHAAHDDVLDQRRVEVVALDQGGEHLAGQVGRVPSRERSV